MTNSPAMPPAGLASVLTRRRLIAGSAVGAGVMLAGGLGWRLFAAAPDASPAAGLQVLSARESAALEVLAMVYFPTGNAVGVDARAAGLVAYVDNWCTQLGPSETRLIRALIFVFDQGTALAGHWRPVRRLNQTEATAYLQGWERSDHGWRRSLASALRSLLGAAYFEHPRVQAAMGMRPACGAGGPTLFPAGVKA